MPVYYKGEDSSSAVEKSTLNQVITVNITSNKTYQQHIFPDMMH